MKTSTRRGATYTREQLEESRALWDAGDFSEEWGPWRHMAAMEAGIIYPPEGTGWDQWDDDHPSQRAILIRAIRETPVLLERCIREARQPSWAVVIEALLHGRDAMRSDIIEERASRLDASPDEASRLLGRIRDIADAADRARVLGAIRAGRCPTCGQALP